MNFVDISLPNPILFELEDLVHSQNDFAKKNKAQIDYTLEHPDEIDALHELRLALTSFAYQYAQENVLDEDDFALSKVKSITEVDVLRPLDLTLQGPNSIEVIETMERWFRNHKILWRQLNIELYADPSFQKNRMMDISLWPMEEKKKFLIQAGIAFLRNQERRTQKKEISKSSAQNLPDAYYLFWGSPFFASAKSYHDDIFIAKTELENRLAIENLTQDDMYQRVMRQIMKSPLLNDYELFFGICQANFQRPLGQMLPSTLWCPRDYPNDTTEITLNVSSLTDCAVCPTNVFALYGSVLEHHGKSIGETSKRKQVECFRWSICFSQLSRNIDPKVSRLSQAQSQFLEQVVGEDFLQMSVAEKHSIVEALRVGPTEIVQQLRKNKE